MRQSKKYNRGRKPLNLIGLRLFITKRKFSWPASLSMGPLFFFCFFFFYLDFMTVSKKRAGVHDGGLIGTGPVFL